MCQENKVTLNNGIVGIFTEPTNTSIALSPGVLLLHGFASHKDEVGDLFRELAVRLAKNNIASLRIDFRGWGESAGDMADTTIDGQITDALVAIDFLRNKPSVQPNNIGLVGFSLGGAIAIILATLYSNPHLISSIVTWSSVGNLEFDFRGSFGDHIFSDTKKHGFVEVDLGWRRVGLKNIFFESLGNYDVLASLGRLTTPILAVAGSEDSSSKYLKEFSDNYTGKNIETYEVIGADHIFNVLTNDTRTSKIVIDKTIRWLIKTLVVINGS